VSLLRVVGERDGLELGSDLLSGKRVVFRGAGSSCEVPERRQALIAAAVREEGRRDAPEWPAGLPCRRDRRGRGVGNDDLVEAARDLATCQVLQLHACLDQQRASGYSDRQSVAVSRPDIEPWERRCGRDCFGYGKQRKSCQFFESNCVRSSGALVALCNCCS
jgi:hypothetical protein